MLLLAFASGLAALSWQVIWQLKSSLALGVSAWGTALTLAVTMAGFCLGALGMGRWLSGRAQANPIRLYAVLEFVIGLCGLTLRPVFGAIEVLDSAVYHLNAPLAPLVHIASIAAALGVATLAMGATLPVFGLIARQVNVRLSRLYALNTLGAALGALLAAFIFIPLFGVTMASFYIAGINLLVALLALLLRPAEVVATTGEEDVRVGSALPVRLMALVAAVTGFATLLLEVAWFRSLTAAYGSTTDAFAIMLAAVLLALGLGARLVPFVQRLGVQPGQLLAAAGIAILLATPVIERFDLVTAQVYSSYSFIILLTFFVMALVFMGIPMLLLGMVLPWLLDSLSGTRAWGRLYALNSFAGVAGSLVAGWVLLPHIGFVRSAWVAGALVASTGLLLLPHRRVFAVLAVAALAVAIAGESGVGRLRAQLNVASTLLDGGRVLGSYNGPDVTTSAVEYSSGLRGLVIDGTLATAQGAGEGRLAQAHYMPWMGHLPALLQERLQAALVICFGTGQTANAVRQEGPQRLDIVDINPHVFDLAPNFSANQGVLQDPRVHTVVMDGRAYLRRMKQRYNVITLEPMPPTHAGVNALYSQEFYRLARARLGDGGAIAQWVPFHLLTPYAAASVVRTFQSVFPNAVLWIDPPSTTGILLATNEDNVPVGSHWPGFAVNVPGRDMDETAVRRALALSADKVAIYGSFGEIISDDNQLLAYGSAVHPWIRSGREYQDSYGAAVALSLQ